MFNSTKIVFQRNGCVNIYHFPLKFEKRGNASHSSVKYSLESGLPYFKFCQSLSDYITQTSDLKLLIGVNLSGEKKSFFKGKKNPPRTNLVLCCAMSFLNFYFFKDTQNKMYWFWSVCSEYSTEHGQPSLFHVNLILKSTNQILILNPNWKEILHYNICFIMNFCYVAVYPHPTEQTRLLHSSRNLKLSQQ